MDKTAIEQIQEAANIPALIKQVEAAGAKIPTALVPKSMTLESLESRMEHAARYRLAYSTPIIDDFISYNKDFDQVGATCFVNADDMSAKSVFDLGTVALPGHKQNSASLKLKETAAFRALINIDGAKQTQKAAAEFLEDWGDEHILVQTMDGDTMNLRAAVKSLRDLSIEAAREVNSKVSDFGESMSAMERIEAKNQDSLPAEMVFTCLPYQGLGEYRFKLRVGILTGEDKPKIVFRILRLEATQEEIAEEFKSKLNESFDGLELKTFIGEV